MISIRLYKPREVDIYTDFPAGWNDCTFAHLKVIASAVFLKQFTQQQLFVELLRVCITISHPHIKADMVARIITLLSIEDMAMHYTQLLAFVNEAVTLTQQPLPAIGAYHGPASNFEDITCGEFEDAETCFYQWQQAMSNNEKQRMRTLVAHLVAILYRPRQSDARVSYTNYNAEKCIPIFMRNQPSLLYTVLLWYMGCKSQLPIMFPLVYSKPQAAAEGTAPMPNFADTEPDPMAITKLIHHGAGPKNGTRNIIREMKLHEFLFDINLESEKETIG